MDLDELKRLSGIPIIESEQLDESSAVIERDVVRSSKLAKEFDANMAVVQSLLNANEPSNSKKLKQAMSKMKTSWNTYKTSVGVTESEEVVTEAANPRIAQMSQHFADLIVGNQTDNSAKELGKIYDKNDSADAHYSSKIDDGKLNKKFASVVHMLMDKCLSDIEKAFQKISKEDK